MQPQQSFSPGAFFGCGRNHSKRLQNISSSETESEPVKKTDILKSTLMTPSKSEDSVMYVGAKSPEPVPHAPKVNQFRLELEIERQTLRQLEINMF